MKLSTEFQTDPDAAWVRRHNDEAREVIAAWRADRPIRVPLLCEDTFIQHGLYASETGVVYGRYYTEPDEMARVQLEAARRRRELPIADIVLGVLPDSWPIKVDFWPVPAPGWVGCRVLYRDNAVPAHEPLSLGREAAEAMPMPDPRTGGILPTIVRFAEEIQQRWGGTTFLGRPVGPVTPGVDHAGVLAMALDVRGNDMLTDLYDDPQFAGRFLLKMAEWCDALEQAWAKDGGGRRGYFRNTDHGIDMLSVETYERFLLPVILEMNRRRGTPLPSGLHHCGRGQHLFPMIKRHYPLQRLDDLCFPMLDIARVRREVGDDVWIKVEIADAIVQCGPPEAIRQAVKDLMRSGAMGRGRLALSLGDLLGQVPMEHRLALYESVKEFGKYPRT